MDRRDSLSLKGTVLFVDSQASVKNDLTWSTVCADTGVRKRVTISEAMLWLLKLRERAASMTRGQNIVMSSAHACGIDPISRSPNEMIAS